MTKHIGGQTNTFSKDDWNEVTRGGVQIIRGPFMPHTKREGSQTSINATKTCVQLGDTTKLTTRIRSMTRLEEKIGISTCTDGPMPHTERKGGQTGTNITRTTTRLENARQGNEEERYGTSRQRDTVRRGYLRRRKRS